MYTTKAKNVVTVRISFVNKKYINVLVKAEVKLINAILRKNNVPEYFLFFIDHLIEKANEDGLTYLYDVFKYKRRFTFAIWSHEYQRGTTISEGKMKILKKRGKNKRKDYDRLKKKFQNVLDDMEN